MSSLLHDAADKEALLKLARPLRRQLHQCPELGFAEWQTLKILLDELAPLPLQLHFLPASLAAQYPARVDSQHEEALYAGTKITIPGLMATLPLKPSGRHVALRCDMDGLALTESTACAHLPAACGFNSTNGCMHACGHDGHMAICLTIIKVLCAHLPELQQTTGDVARLSFIFQGAEEGCAGAQVWLDSGLIDDIDELYCFHLGMGLPAGSFSPCAVNFLATRKFNVSAQGKKAHAGRPQQGAHALRALCELITKAMALQDATAQRLINFGVLHCPGARNIIPDAATAQGELRARSREELESLTCSLEACTAAAQQAVAGTELRLDYCGYGLPITGDRRLEDALRRAAQAVGLSISPDFAFEASEDASLLIDYVQRRGGSGIYSVCGAALAAGHHQTNFDFNEEVLSAAAALYLHLLAARCKIS